MKEFLGPRSQLLAWTELCARMISLNLCKKLRLRLGDVFVGVQTLDSKPTHDMTKLLL